MKLLLLFLFNSYFLSAQFINIINLGAYNDGTHSLETTNAFTTFFSSPTSSLYVPPGNYLIDNTNGPLNISNFSGYILFDGNAKLIFLNKDRGGLFFTGGSNAKIQNLHISYQTLPNIRGVEDALKFSGTTDTVLTDSIVDMSPGEGVLFYASIRPKVVNLQVSNGLAGGLGFSNCQDPQVTQLTSENTGDDGLAFVSYQGGPNYTGGLASNITIRNSQARGIAIAGQSNVVIDNFLVDTTTASGILVLYDSVFSTQTPDNIKISNGTIENTSRFGVEYLNTYSISFSNIFIINSLSRGVSGIAPLGHIYLSDIYTSGTKDDGFNLSAYILNLANITSESSQKYGIYISNSDEIIAKNIVTRNSSLGSSLNRAIWFDNNKSLIVNGGYIIDAQNTPTGFIIGEANNFIGWLVNIFSYIPHGNLVVSNLSPNVKFQVFN